MAGSDYSGASGGTVAGPSNSAPVPDVSDGSAAYAPVSITTNGGQEAVTVALETPVPLEAPPLPPGAGAGLYEVNSGRFYSHWGDNLVSWSSTTSAWVVANRWDLLLGGAKFLPSIAQGIASFLEGKAAFGLNVTGIAGQVLPAAIGLGKAYRQSHEGGYVDQTTIFTNVGRLISAALNTAAAVLDKSTPSGSAVNSIATGLSMSSTTVEFMNDLSKKQHAEETQPYGGWHQNTRMLGSGLGDYLPGSEPMRPPPPVRTTTMFTGGSSSGQSGNQDPSAGTTRRRGRQDSSRSGGGRRRGKG